MTAAAQANTDADAPVALHFTGQGLQALAKQSIVLHTILQNAADALWASAALGESPQAEFAAQTVVKLLGGTSAASNTLARRFTSNGTSRQTLAATLPELIAEDIATLGCQAVDAVGEPTTQAQHAQQQHSMAAQDMQDIVDLLLPENQQPEVVICCSATGVDANTQLLPRLQHTQHFSVWSSTSEPPASQHMVLSQIASCQKAVIFILSANCWEDRQLLAGMRVATRVGKHYLLVHDADSCRFPDPSQFPADVRDMFDKKAVTYLSAYADFDANLIAEEIYTDEADVAPPPVADLERQQSQAAMAEVLQGAPAYLASLGLAFRAFLSHRRLTAQGAVGRIYSEVGKTYRMFLDSEAKFLLHNLRELVQATHTFIFFMSEGILESHFCLEEFNTAVEAHKPIVLVSMADYHLPSQLPAGLPPQSQAALLAAWEQRLVYHAEHFKPFIERLQQRLGMPDAVLDKLPRNCITAMVQPDSTQAVDLVSLASPACKYVVFDEWAPAPVDSEWLPLLTGLMQPGALIEEVCGPKYPYRNIKVDQQVPVGKMRAGELAEIPPGGYNMAPHVLTMFAAAALQSPSAVLTSVALCIKSLEETKALAAGLAVNTTITTLYLESTFGEPALSDDGTAVLAWAIQCNASLTSLHFGWSIATAGGLALASAFARNPRKLQQLNLDSNELMGPTVAVAMAAAIGKCKKLTLLNLSKTAMQAEGHLAMAHAVKIHPSLTEVNVAANRLSERQEEVGRAWGEALASSCSLASFCIDRCDMGTAGMTALLSSLAASTTSMLKDIRLSDNDVDSQDEPLKAAVAAVKANPNLQALAEHLDAAFAAIAE
ncbi:hypothetical protein WJX72_006166 [[Myrmecia] bisecta]|uniref:TIR domain-containing protein n=1 Tax=[Myrmecia] bisecta TaxID=41462 RepID=A0AAW1PXD7_9CHLO